MDGDNRTQISDDKIVFPNLRAAGGSEAGESSVSLPSSKVTQSNAKGNLRTVTGISEVCDIAHDAGKRFLDRGFE